MELLKITNVEKSFGNKKILKNINLDIKRGKIIGLLGKNGMGKTETAEKVYKDYCK